MVPSLGLSGSGTVHIMCVFFVDIKSPGNTLTAFIEHSIVHLACKYIDQVVPYLVNLGIKAGLVCPSSFLR